MELAPLSSSQFAMIPTPVEFDAPSFEINRMFGRSASVAGGVILLAELSFPVLTSRWTPGKSRPARQLPQDERQLPLNDVPIQPALCHSPSRLGKGENFQPFLLLGIPRSMSDNVIERVFLVCWGKPVQSFY